MSKTPIERVLSGEQLSINDADLVPGTIHLVDLQNTLHLKKDANRSDNIILQPQPSSNPNDPLRWSQRKKNWQFAFLFTWSFFLAVTVNWVGPYWTEWVEEFNTSYNDLNVSSALCFLFLGLGCLFLQPTALKMGRRFVYLICTILALVANIIGTQTKSINYLYVTNIISGFAAAPVDSLVEISSTDVFFVHERASKLSFLILALYAGSDLGPVVAGYMPSWQWCYILQAIIMAVMFVAQLFLMEDSTFDREDHTEEEVMQQIRSHDVMLEAVRSGAATPEMIEKNLSSADVKSEASDDDSVNHSIPMRSYWQRMRLYELEYNDKRSWLTIFLRPFLLVTFPALIWGGVVYGAQMMWLSLLATTQSEIYVTYYGFSTSSTGLTNLSPLIGSIFGMFYGGHFVDWLSVKLAKRNNGIMEPEFRLWAMVVPTILNATGLLAYGLASNAQAPWPISVVLGQAMLGFSMSSSGPICLTYAVDSYPNLASEGLVLMLFIRNLIGCGFTFAIQPWLARNGLVTTTWLMFMLALVINGSFVVLIIWGKLFRRWTKANYLKYSDPKYGEFF